MDTAGALAAAVSGAARIGAAVIGAARTNAASPAATVARPRPRPVRVADAAGSIGTDSVGVAESAGSVGVADSAGSVGVADSAGRDLDVGNAGTGVSTLSRFAGFSGMTKLPKVVGSCVDRDGGAAVETHGHNI
ncbi:MAG: hypothetical protein QOI74_3135 [Micromonosporaceae bacterium]|nr:hypothetical protein [Micromonosporaceae bacterium]